MKIAFKNIKIALALGLGLILLNLSALAQLAPEKDVNRDQYINLGAKVSSGPVVDSMDTDCVACKAHAPNANFAELERKDKQGPPPASPATGDRRDKDGTK